MRKNSKFVALSLVSGFTAFCAAIGTVSWFVNYVEFSDIRIGGSSFGAYFAYGDGLPYEEDGEGNIIHQPYGIKTQRHLYNLSWLQYNGTFNKDEDGDGVIDQQFYFVIDPSLQETGLDMAGWIIPPIGTEKYPFLGNFEGNNVTISNLTVSNQTAFNKTEDYPYGSKPTKISYDTANNPRPKVVGFFGVVGEIVGDELDYTYDSSINGMEDFILENITVESKTSETLIGLAAGYVNGTMSNVLIDSSSDSASTIDVNSQVSSAMTSITGVTELSHYGLVGYSANVETGGHQQKEITQYYNSELDTDGDDADWGGSVDMDKMYTRLDTLRGTKTASAHPYYTYSKILDNDKNNIYTGGDAIPNNTIQNYISRQYNTGNDFRGCFNYEQGNHADSKIYLTGGEYHTDYLYNTSNFYGRYITDGSNNYLNSALGNSNTNNTSTLDGTYLWKYVQSNNGYYIYSYSDANGRYTYLRNDNGTLATVTATNSNVPNNATLWTITQNNTNMSIENVSGGTTYRLMFVDDAWVLRNPNQQIVTPAHYSMVYNNNTYLPSTVIGRTASGALAGVRTDELSFNTPTSGQPLSFTYEGDPYYLFVRNSNTSYLSASTENNNTTTINGNTYYRLTYYVSDGNTYVVTQNAVNRYYYYLRYDNGWAVVRGSRNGQKAATAQAINYSFNLIPASDPIYPYLDEYVLNNLTGDEVRANPYNTNETNGYMRFDSTNTSYFPLTVYENDDDEVAVDSSKLYNPKITNTGYIVSAATGRLEQNSQGNTFNYLRSVTFNRYNTADKLRENTSYTIDNEGKYSLINVRTVNDAGNIVAINESDYVKYASSKAKLENTLSNSNGKVSGIHFTNTAGLGNVSKNNVVKATNIMILDDSEQGYSTYASGYELPVYSIDFKLKQQGYINFFAGSYNGSTNCQGCDCFFSLHQIFRDLDGDVKTIDEIKEISEIYGTEVDGTYSYMYKYTDNTYSKPYRVDVIDGKKYELSTDPLAEPVLYTERHNLNATEFNAFRNNYSYTKIFDVSRLWEHDAVGNSTYARTVFYFEIPVDGGEYCLGNTDGAEGCYMMYLDIGANGNEVKDTFYTYNIITKQEYILYPVGVDFAADGVSGNGGDTFCIFIASQDRGVVSFTFNNDKDDMTVTDVSHITEYSYLSIGGYCEISGNSPGEGLLADPEVVITRTSYIHTEPNENAEAGSLPHDIMIVDELEEVTQGNETSYIITSSTYYVDGDEVTQAGLFNAVPSIGGQGILEAIRNRDVVIILELTNAKSVYDLVFTLEELPWLDPETGEILDEAPPYYNITYTEPNADFIVTIINPQGETIRVKVNGTQVNSGSTYHYVAP